MKEQILKLGSVSNMNDSIEIVYRKFVGSEYIGAVGNYALLVYKLKNNDIVGINLGFKKENDVIYNCDIEKQLLTFYIIMELEKN